MFLVPGLATLVRSAGAGIVRFRLWKIHVQVRALEHRRSLRPVRAYRQARQSIRSMEGHMAHVPATRETIRLDEGDVVVLLPANLSYKSIGILQAQLVMLAAGLNSRSDEDGQSHLRGLAGLAAYVAN